MTTTWVVRQGTKGRNAEEMIEAGYMGVDFIGDYDIAPHLGRGADAFRSAMTLVFLEMKPDKNKVAAGLAVGNLWWACEGIVEGDVVLAPKPDRTYEYGVVSGGYEYHPGNELPHRRRVNWNGSFSRDAMSPALASSAGSLMTVFLAISKDRTRLLVDTSRTSCSNPDRLLKASSSPRKMTSESGGPYPSHAASGS